MVLNLLVRKESAGKGRKNANLGKIRHNKVVRPKRKPNLEILMVPSGFLQAGRFNTRQRPFAGKDANLIAQLLHLGEPLLALLLCGSNTDEVLEKLRTSFFLENEGKLDCAVEEVSDDLDVLLLHVTRGQSGGTEADTTRDLSGGIAGNSVFWKGGLGHNLRRK